jgi:hypothetical protein
VIGQRWELSNTIDRFTQTLPWLPRDEPVGALLPHGATPFELLHSSTSKATLAPSRNPSCSRRQPSSSSRGRAWLKRLTLSPRRPGEISPCHFRRSLGDFWRAARSLSPSQPGWIECWRFFKTYQRSDAPEALTLVRNALIHPGPSKRKRHAL